MSNLGFNLCPGHGTLDQLYTLRRVLEGSWEFAQPVHMCFVDLEKAFDRVPRGILWEVLREYGVGGPLLRAVRSLYERSRSLVRIAGSKSDLFPVHVGLRQGCPLSPVLFIIFMDRISRRSQGPEGVWFREPLDFISAFRRQCCLVGSFEPGPPACPGAVYSQVWSPWFLTGKGGLLPQGWGRAPASGGGV